jgi:hypothetical protein
MVDALCESLSKKLVVAHDPLTDELRADLQSNFFKGITGYHFTTDTPLKESNWENVNADVLRASRCTVTSQANGSHKSGGDLSTSLGVFSNKTAKYGKNQSFDVSSYRLTTVCSNKTPGQIENIQAEIKKRKNFDYYSILVRDENEAAKTISYDWYLIPSDFSALVPESYSWEHALGQKGDKKGTVTGWKTNTHNGSSMKIQFSLSSQL